MTRTSEAAPERPVRVLAFTASRDRPALLRHAVLQMQAQTYPVDHAIYINAAASAEPTQVNANYARLVADAAHAAPERVIVTLGASGTFHQNYLAAIFSVDPNAYDIFLKIDDDDIYFAHYVDSVVASYLAENWDYSGSASIGVLKGAQWDEKLPLKGLGLEPEDHDLGIPDIMPPTLALSRRAVLALQDMPDTGDFDDRQWRRYLARYGGMKMTVRPERHFVYHVHGANASTGGWMRTGT